MVREAGASRAWRALAGAALLFLLPFLLPVSTVTAASCNGASHSITLSSGRASPGTGWPTTAIVFRVTYADSAGCKPNAVSLKIPGSGSYSMSPSGSNWTAGVTFTRTLHLPVGRWGFSFTATSGTGGGLKTATLSKVSPSAVVISAPAPSPTPNPTPKPTPRPTPKPTPPPTASPRPSSSPRPTGTPRPSPTASPSKPVASRKPSPSPSNQHAGGGGSAGKTATPTPQPVAQGGRPGPGSTPFSMPDLAHSPVSAVTVYLAATAGGLWFFGFLLRRHGRRPLEAEVSGLARPLPADDPAAMPEPVTARTFAPAEPGKSSAASGEATMPRWLRPSVQRGRGQDTIRRRSWE